MLQTGYRRYHAAKEGGEGPAIPATGWLEEQSDDSMTAPPTAPTPDGTTTGPAGQPESPRPIQRTALPSHAQSQSQSQPQQTLMGFSVHFALTSPSPY